MLAAEIVIKTNHTVASAAAIAAAGAELSRFDYAPIDLSRIFQGA